MVESASGNRETLLQVDVDAGDRLDVTVGPADRVGWHHIGPREVPLTNEIAATLEARGFDPAVGYLHGLRYGRKSLALDVIEVFRQPLIDRLTLRLLNKRQLGPEDFEGGEKGTRLLPDSLKRYLELYEERLSSPSAGKDSPSWREQINDQAASLKGMIMSGEVAPLYAWED